MSISFQAYLPCDWDALVSMMSQFWDDLIAMDCYGRMQHPPDYGPVYSRELLNKIETQQGVFLWAIEAGRKIGLVAGIIEQQSEQNRVEIGPSKAGRILELYVEAAYRKRGVGDALMHEIEQYFNAQGCDALKLEVFALNESARSFYKRLGYADWTVDMFKRILPK